MIKKTVTLIPAEKKITSSGKSDYVRVAAYARVSSLPQEESYESQVEHFTSLISSHPNWKLIHVYGDEGISGLNTKKRDGFNLMIRDGKRNKYDLLLVKSISRMGRNTVDLLNAIRDLKASGVSVFFEKENINTGETTGEMLITLLSAFAQSESESISANVRIGYQYKMARGEHSLAYSRFLGYDKGEDGKLEINKEQAKTVRFIFDRFLYGMTLFDLTRLLETEGYLTGAGNSHWTKTGVSRILRNEKMCGCALLGKTTVTDVLNKIREKNIGQAPQYFVNNDHEPIVDIQTYLLARGELIRRSNKCTSGPSLVHHRNDYTGKLICPLCGNNYDRKNAKKEYNWICYGRVKNVCDAKIIKEQKLNEATLLALQKLWDLQPKVRPAKVPSLKMNESDDALEKAATIFMNNQFAKRVMDFCRGERPVKYDPDTTWKLIEKITHKDNDLTYRFYDGSEVFVSAEIFTGGKNKK